MSRTVHYLNDSNSKFLCVGIPSVIPVNLFTLTEMLRLGVGSE